jgi:hypothetical protein
MSSISHGRITEKTYKYAASNGVGATIVAVVLRNFQFLQNERQKG